MTEMELIQKIVDFSENCAENHVAAEDAVLPELIGLKMYAAPIVGFAAADDALFTEVFKREGVISPEYRCPKEWLPGAKTVISFFLPFTDRVKESNRAAVDVPYEPGLPQKCSSEWLHARVEGQLFINAVTDYIQKMLADEGFESICPTSSHQLKMITPYISTWSERHAAFAAGLGTFGLSKGLITEKGMAGRFGSVITNAVFAPSERKYTDAFEYCTMCGACMRRCPANAIDIARGCALGKDQPTCKAYVTASRMPPHGANQRARYGCGKCQTAVPCESGIPGRK